MRPMGKTFMRKTDGWGRYMNKERSDNATTNTQVNNKREKKKAY